MSNAYAKKLEKDGEVDMRAWCQRPGRRDDEGKIIYFTEQSHKKQCDVNLIIKRFDKTGVLAHVQSMEGKYGDVSGADFRKAQDLFLSAQASFEALPSKIRARFSNNAGEFLEFMDNPANRDEAIELGLIRKDYAEDADGLGEHLKSADDYKKVKKDKDGNVIEDAA